MHCRSLLRSIQSISFLFSFSSLLSPFFLSPLHTLNLLSNAPPQLPFPFVSPSVHITLITRMRKPFLNIRALAAKWQFGPYSPQTILPVRLFDVPLYPPSYIPSPLCNILSFSSSTLLDHKPIPAYITPPWVAF